MRTITEASGAGLSEKQKLCLDYIKGRLSESGISPSFEQIKEHLGIASKSGVHRLVHALAAKGHIHILKDRYRSISLTQMHQENDGVPALLAAIEGQAKAMQRGSLGAERGGESIVSMIRNYRKGVRI